MHEVKIVCLLQNPVLESPAEALEVPVVDVEHVALHDCSRETPEDPRILDAGLQDLLMPLLTDASVSCHVKNEKMKIMVYVFRYSMFKSILKLNIQIEDIYHNNIMLLHCPGNIVTKFTPKY